METKNLNRIKVVLAEKNRTNKWLAERLGKDPATVKVPHQLSEADIALANKVTPLEQAERNKEYALFTMAILQKTYGDVRMRT